MVSESLQTDTRKSSYFSRLRARGITVKWLILRLLLIPVSLFAVATISFLIVNLSPGDPARVIAGPAGGDQLVAEIRQKLGLDQPLWDRYTTYVSGLLRGDLGTSYYSETAVLTEVLRRLPATIELVIPSLLFAVAIGLSIGVLGEYFRTRTSRAVSSSAISITQSLPDFYLGLVLSYVFYGLLKWLPAPTGRLHILDLPPKQITGLYTVDSLLAGDLAVFKSALLHAILPVATLAIVYSAYFAKVTRASLREELHSKYIEFATGLGHNRKTIMRFALLTARTQLLNYGAILMGVVIGGTAIIEKVFSWGGVGDWALGAILNLDLPVIQGFILFTGAVALLTYVALDITVAMLDPRMSGNA